MNANFELCCELEYQLSEHEQSKKRSISLIPTENLLSPKAMKMLQSDLANRYYLTDNTIWEYPQIEHMASVSDLCEASLKRLYNVKYANVRPISGINCMTVILAALTKQGQTIYSINPNCGGHGATRVIAERLGLRCFYLPYDYQEFDLDYEQCRRAFYNQHPDFIYIDMSNSLFTIDLQKLRSIAPPNTFIHYDASQIMGLLLDKDYFNPLSYECGLLAGSTHKTFPGPQHGMILSNDPALMTRIETYTNTFVSNHHMNNVASLAMTALEMMEFGSDYSKRIRSNAVKLGEELIERGIPVVKCSKGITCTHQLWINPIGLNQEAHEIVRKLRNNNIITNCVRLPFSEDKMVKGIRLGTTEVSRLGMGADEMKIIADLIFQTVSGADSNEKIRLDVERLHDNYTKK